MLKENGIEESIRLVRMASKSKLTRSPQWWKHLKEFKKEIKMKSYRAKVDNIQAIGRMQERLLQEIRDVLLRMEGRLNTIESMIYVDDVAKKQILKGNE